MRKEMTSVLNKITQDWFLSEPLLFSVYCTHELVENQKMSVPFRTGQLRIEYNPRLLAELKINQIAEYLKIECFRILLKHPYQRQPTGAKKPYLTVSSDAVIYSTYQTDVKLEGVEVIKDIMDRILLLNNPFDPQSKKLYTENDHLSLNSAPLQIPASEIQKYLNKNQAIRITKVENGIEAKIDKDRFFFEKSGEIYKVKKWNSLLNRWENVYGAGVLQFWKEHVKYVNGMVSLPKDLCFEEWYTKLLMVMETTTEEGNDKVLSDQSSLWGEDNLAQAKINNLIEDTEKSMQWGSVSGAIKELIQANRTVEMNYGEILRHFSTSIISSNRRLTRMKPNRRFGFERLGSRYNISSRLLIAVDVSSSINRSNLEYVFSIINQFFRYGIEKIDVIQFDKEIKGGVMEMSSACETVEIHGRGGTEFQPAADFYCQHKEYDGLIFFTDGFGPHPVFKGRQKVDVLWIFTSQTYYTKGKVWVEKIPGNMATFIPLI
ncbi:MAG: VWA-like domain-containing protein [Treponema sp.]|nr:VWA-like domain-containing protein [Treponema sp.]